MQSQYTRSVLVAATSGFGLNGRCDPVKIADLAASDLRRLLDSGRDFSDTQDAYDLLAFVGRLKRIKPDLLTQVRAQELLDRAQPIIDKEFEIVHRAVEVPNLPAWITDAQRLQDSYGPHKELMDHEQRSRWARELLQHLDDAELVHYMTSLLESDDKDFKGVITEIGDSLQVCRQWLKDNADAFLAASRFVLETGESLRPDLQEFDAGLAATAAKYIDLLDEIEAAQADIECQPGSEGDPKVIDLVKKVAQV